MLMWDPLITAMFVMCGQWHDIMSKSGFNNMTVCHLFSPGFLEAHVEPHKTCPSSCEHLLKSSQGNCNMHFWTHAPWANWVNHALCYPPAMRAHLFWRFPASLVINIEQFGEIKTLGCSLSVTFHVLWKSISCHVSIDPVQFDFERAWSRKVLAQFLKIFKRANELLFIGEKNLTYHMWRQKVQLCDISFYLQRPRFSAETLLNNMEFSIQIFP